MENIQSILKELTSQSDPRTSVFEVEIVSVQDTRLRLRGRLLEESQLEALSRHFSSWTLDTSSIRILQRGDLPRMHVVTNVTGLYERPTFGMPLSSELSYGTGVEVLEEQGNWVFTRQKDGYLGWAYKPYFAEGFPAEPTHLVLAPSCELRAGPGADSEVRTRLVSGTGVVLEGTRGEWAHVAASQTGWMPVSLLRAIQNLPSSLEEKRRSIVEDSARMTGVPYLWGGTSGNGIDCSGFVRLLHRWVGVDIPRDADLQHAAAGPVEPPFEVGDLLFFGESGSERSISHVGLSLGGWTIVHASRGRNGVYIDDVQERQGLKQIFVSAGSFLR